MIQAGLPTHEMFTVHPGSVEGDALLPVTGERPRGVLGNQLALFLSKNYLHESVHAR